MAQVCGYPIYVSIAASVDVPTDYEITVDGELIYTGRVYSSDGRVVDVDISDICAAYLNPDYESIIQNGGIVNNSVKSFTINPGGAFTVCYGYNTDYILDIPAGTNLNHPATGYVDPRQLIGTSTMSNSGISVAHSRPTGSVGTTIIIGGNEFTIVPECRNRYALYYVNKDGGIDYLLVHGKTTDRWDTTRIDARLYNDRTNRRTFENTRIYQDVTKSYTLNTSYINDDQAANIDHLIYSPKVWIHDLDNNTITACLIEDSAYTIKSFRNDTLVAYDINVSESQLYRRR